MSDNIPLEIQREIMKNLPVKSVMRFRSVSKAWKALIDSKDFITHHTHITTQTHPHFQMLIRYGNPKNKHKKYVSIDDDDTFPQHKLTFTNLPIHVKLLLAQHSTIVGSSHGLFLLYGDFPNPSRFDPCSVTKMAVLWNPSIQKSIAIELPDVCILYETVVGFGVCPQNYDPKLVKIVQFDSRARSLTGIRCVTPLEVKVFTLSSGVWRNPLCSYDLPLGSIHFRRSQVVIGTFMYWFAYSERIKNGGRGSFNLIISFDMNSEEFAQISLPFMLAHHPDDDLPISKLKESLVLLEYDIEEDNRVYGIWKMTKLEDGVTNIFTKLYTINLLDGSKNTLLGFRNNGEPIIDIRYSKVYMGYDGLYVYENDSKQIKYIEGLGSWRTTSVEWNFVGSYMETLLLLDH